ncbi:MAG: type I 3-dehydroquinate dehydratase, partial [Methanobacteriota archaeon]
SKAARSTCRKAGERGTGTGTDDERLALIRETAKLSPTYIDVELSIGEELHNLGRAIKEGGTKLIISHHDFERTPSYEDLSSIVEKQYAYGADIAKVACMGTSMADNVKVFRLISDNVARGREVIGLVMGRYGKLSRVASPMLGAHLTFASLESGKESAPGQLSIDEMRRAYELLS